LFHLLVFLSKDLSSSNGVDQEFTDDGKVGSTSITGGAMIAFVCLIFVFW